MKPLPRRVLLALLATLSCVMLGCGPSPAGGPPSLELGTGATSFQSVTDGQALSIVHGPQGGIHLFVAGRCRGLGDPVNVKFGLRDADTGESVSYLSLEAMVHPTPLGDADAFAGLTARFIDNDASVYAGRRVVVWASATGDGHEASDERTVVVTAN
jgi:hypothetical protein